MMVQQEYILQVALRKSRGGKECSESKVQYCCCWVEVVAGCRRAGRCWVAVEARGGDDDDDGDVVMVMVVVVVVVMVMVMRRGPRDSGWNEMERSW
jgi:hypothetical protein